MRSGKKLYKYANIGHIEPPTDGNWSSRLPFFVRNKSTIQKSLGPFDFLFRIHSTQQRTPNPLPRPVFRPLFQSPPTGWWENHIAGACPPKYNRFSRRREFRSGFFADLRADVRVPVLVWEEEVQSQPIVRLSAHVSYSYFHLPFYIGRSCF